MPGKGIAIAAWFVPFVNLVHPFTTLRRIQRGTRVQTPVGWWWLLFLASLVLGGVGGVRLKHGGYDAVFVIASVMEIVAVYLCWKIVRDFRRADQEWDPRAALARRELSVRSES